MKTDNTKFTLYYDKVLLAKDPDGHPYTDEVVSIQIGATNYLSQCFRIAERHVRNNEKDFELFAWNDFEDVSYMFHITEWNIEIIDGYKVPQIIASANMEEVLADYNVAPKETQDLIKYTA